MHDLADAHCRNPHAALCVDRQSVRHSLGHLREDAPVLDPALVRDVVNPDRARVGIRMVQMFSVGTETETVADLDAVPKFYRTAGRIDAKQAARNRLVVAEWVEVYRARENAAVIVGGEVVHADRLAFPGSKQVAALAGLLVPMNQRAAGEHEPTAAVKVHPADALAFGDQ